MNPSYKIWITVFVLFSISACSEIVYIADDIDAQVIDAETGQPIEGANVVANWQLEQAMLHGYRMKGQLKVMETVTDKEGRFHFDGFRRFNWPNRGLYNQDPQVIIFKAGYEHRRIINHYHRAGTKTPGKNRVAAVDGMVVKLRKMNLPEKTAKSGNDLMVYVRLETQISYLTSFAKDCEWEEIPNFILAMDAEKKRILSQYPDAYVGLIGIEGIHSDRGCSSTSEIFKKGAKK